MAVFRVKKNKNYTAMSNYHLKEKKLSFKAKGLLTQILSLPEDWEYSVNGLTALATDGKESVASGLAELEKFGYLKRTKYFDEKGKFAGYNYDIFEAPLTEKPLTEKPLTEKPLTEKPLTEKPLTEKPPQLNTNKSNTNILNTKKEKKESIKKESETKRFTPPTLEEVKEYCVERKNNVDAERFIDYYTANGWKVGRNSMKDWQAAVRTWEKKSLQFYKSEPKHCEPKFIDGAWQL